MASPVPPKLQPLHNFSLPHLKWKNHRSGRSRHAGETSSSSPPHQSPPTPCRESPPPTSHAYAPPKRQSSPSHVLRRPSPLHKQSPMRDSECQSERNHAASQVILTKSLTKSVDNDNKGQGSSKTCVRYRKNISNNKQNDGVPEEIHSSRPVNDVAPAAEDEDTVPKTWNLRPRRHLHKQSNGGLPKIGPPALQEDKTNRVSDFNKESSELNINSNPEKSKKQKFSVVLSRDEIEDDIFLLTGSKPSRRPKKRPRAVQRQLDTLFPGLWLDSITADSYKVSEAPTTKGQT